MENHLSIVLVASGQGRKTSVRFQDKLSPTSFAGGTGKKEPCNPQGEESVTPQIPISTPAPSLVTRPSRSHGCTTQPALLSPLRTHYVETERK